MARGSRDSSTREWRPHRWHRRAREIASVEPLTRADDGRGWEWVIRGGFAREDVYFGSAVTAPTAGASSKYSPAFEQHLHGMGAIAKRCSRHVTPSSQS